ncbi:hypothetical protein CONPUDRAFT_144181 [Coniophora puteana RWD-64-598 SS2]|uniref:Uncharacterized protein n=1 Tax=Coniophora puteana (strain RWD-64-598) TaxID=741705 RepID=A0A5M3MQQ2_CONPW|nr:uncharacterized protein CONPUDRAFT_144181 [Coniophora puteana RWD-64-598 SS2]EIW81386.1 hypothetical protein CONPUDRAFT_144181 [Coniophora puteana RWD-64-598 SS2]
MANLGRSSRNIERAVAVDLDNKAWRCKILPLLCRRSPPIDVMKEPGPHNHTFNCFVGPRDGPELMGPFLTGVICILYFRKFRKDMVKIRLLVAVLLSVASWICQLSTVWQIVTNLCHSVSMLTQFPPEQLVWVLSVTTTILVKIFFVYRLWKLSASMVFPTLCAIISLSSYATGLAIVAEVIRNTGWTKWVITYTFVSSAVSDVISNVALSVYLRKSRRTTSMKSHPQQKSLRAKQYGIHHRKLGLLGNRDWSYDWVNTLSFNDNDKEDVGLHSYRLADITIITVLFGWGATSQFQIFTQTRALPRSTVGFASEKCKRAHTPSRISPRVKSTLSRASWSILHRPPNCPSRQIPKRKSCAVPATLLMGMIDGRSRSSFLPQDL